MTKLNIDIPRFGTYRNGHNPELIKSFNRKVESLSATSILEELMVNYFDDEDIRNITIFFEERFDNL